MSTQTSDTFPELIADGKLVCDERQLVELATGQQLIVLRVELAPGVSEPAHTHPGPAVFYPLSGTGVIELDGTRRVDLVKNEAVYLPEGTTKAFINTTDEPMEVLAIVLKDTRRAPYTVVA
jgi:quercetin dioxygenase-like cupin family protein